MWLWTAVAILVAGMMAGAVWWKLRPQVILLGDGTKLRLVAVTYGKHHNFPGNRVPVRANRRNGALDSTNDTLFVWIEQQHKGNQWPNYQVLAYDQAATACAGNWGSGGGMRQIKNGVELVGVRLDAFPRHDRKISLRFVSWGTHGRQVAKGQMVIPNPARGGSFESWTPESLPDVQSDGDLDVTLTKLVYGVPGFNGGDHSSKDPMNKAVLAAFHTEQKGVVITNWQPTRIETSDATGNHVYNNSWSNGHDDNGDATMTYQWGLWPDEPAWKLRVEMSRVSGFSDDEMWTAQNVPVHAGRQQDLWNYGGRNRQTGPAFAETTLNGIHLKLFPAVQFTDQNPGNGEKAGGVRVTTEPDLPEGYRLTVIATDETGHPLRGWGPNGGGGNYVAQFPDLGNSTTLNITLALHKSRFVEYTVKPTKE